MAYADIDWKDLSEKDAACRRGREYAPTWALWENPKRIHRMTDKFPIRVGLLCLRMTTQVKRWWGAI